MTAPARNTTAIKPGCRALIFVLLRAGCSFRCAVRFTSRGYASLRPVEAFVHDVPGLNGRERHRDVAPFAVVGAAGGGGEADAAGQNSLDVGIVIDGKCLVAGAEVDDL